MQITSSFLRVYYTKRGEVVALADLLVDAGEDEAVGVTSVCHSSHLPTYGMTEDGFPFLCLD